MKKNSKKFSKSLSGLFLSGIFFLLFFPAIPFISYGQDSEISQTIPQRIKDSIRLADFEIRQVMGAATTKEGYAKAAVKKYKMKMEFSIKGKTNFFTSCEVFVSLPDDILKAWKSGGQKGSNVKLVNNMLQILANGAYIDNISRKEAIPFEVSYSVKRKKTAKPMKAGFTFNVTESTVVKGKPVKLNEKSEILDFIIPK